MNKINTLTLGREEFVQKILSKSNGDILEIGPLNRPLIVGKFMSYFDLYPTIELKARATQEGLDPNTVPEINYNHPEGNLSSITRKFHDVISSHCLEHQPNLIRHLSQVSQILQGGRSRYWVVLPDKRFCFDALLPESSLSQIVQANYENPKKPNIWKVIEHRALTTHNDSIQHWQGFHGPFGVDLKARWQSAIKEFEAAEGNYIDVHCWQFTPNSFGQIISGLYTLGFIDFEVEELFETPVNGIEFCAVLKKT